MQLADALVTCLRDLELKYLFGVSGANIEHIHDAIYRLGANRFRTVMTKSEYGAAFMADTRARVHKTLGVCCATSGGGMMNLAVGIAESCAQNVPVFAIIGQPPLTQEGCGAFQDSSGLSGTINAEKMLSAIAKHVCKVTHASHFWSQLKDALILPLQDRQGPSVMLIPRDLMTQDVGDPPAHFLADILQAHRPPPPAHALPAQSLPEAALATVWQRLVQAKRPLLILGSAVARESCEALAIQFADATGMTVATTLACTNAFPHASPQFIGMIGAAGHPSAHDFLENEADFVLALGTQLSAMHRATAERALQRKPLAVINGFLDQLDPALQPDYAIPLDARQALTGLLALQAQHPVVFNRCEAGVSYQDSHMSLTHPITPTANSLTQFQALEQIQRILPNIRHLLFDAGNCAATAAHYLRIPQGTSTTIALGMGGMGYAIAGAIGAQLGEAADQRTLVIGGDGSFMMAGLEIHTAVDLKLPVLWVIFNNNQHGMCVTRQQIYFDGRIEGNTYSTINIAQIARGFGETDALWCGCASTPGELNHALQRYFAGPRRPGVLELKISDASLPPFMPFLQHRATVVAPY